MKKENILEKNDLKPILNFINNEFIISDKKSDAVINIKALVKYLSENEINLNYEDASELLSSSNALHNTMNIIVEKQIDIPRTNDSIENLFLSYDLTKNDSEHYVNSYSDGHYYMGKKTNDLDTLKLYLESLPPLLTPEEERKYAYLSATGNEEAKHRLIESNLRLVISIAKRYCKASKTVTLQDLIQEGNIGLMKAADRFDYTKGYKFSTYATWWIRQGIRRFIADTSRTIRIPANQYEYVRKMNAIKSRLFNELQRMPTDIELAQALEITVDKLHYLQNIEIDAVSLSAPINDNDDTDVLGDFIEDKSTNVEEEIVKKEYLESFKNAVLESEILDQREKEIICLRYGINCDRAHSLEEIGQKMGVTRERIRQIENKSLRKLGRDKNIKKYNSGYNPEKITASYVKNIQPIKQPKPVKKEEPILRRRYLSYYSL
ncbi:MAG: sigma-70 family RNA polymerase sigma factor [Clostridium sp.]|nr:sigma-70 family RNA polymerase sigma factor [Clostridium sp.]